MVGIIILNYNNSQLTIECVESIKQWNTQPCKFIIVDNASTDNSAEVLNTYLTISYVSEYAKFSENDSRPDSLPVYSLIVANSNSGYARGNNLGCDFAEKDTDIGFILILNNDTLFVEDILPQMVRFIMAHTDAALVNVALIQRDTGRIAGNTARTNYSVGDIMCMYSHFNKLFIKINKNHQVLVNHPELLQKEFVEVEVPVGACLLIRKELFKEIGYFDPHTFLYFEENILFKKIQRVGLKNYLLPQLRLIHLGGETIHNTKFSRFQEIQKFKSSYHYVMNYSGVSNVYKPFIVLMYHINVMIINVGFFIDKIRKGK